MEIVPNSRGHFSFCLNFSYRLAHSHTQIDIHLSSVCVCGENARPRPKEITGRACVCVRNESTYTQFLLQIAQREKTCLNLFPPFPLALFSLEAGHHKSSVTSQHGRLSIDLPLLVSTAFWEGTHLFFFKRRRRGGGRKNGKWWNV